MLYDMGVETPQGLVSCRLSAEVMFDDTSLNVRTSPRMNIS